MAHIKKVSESVEGSGIEKEHSPPPVQEMPEGGVQAWAVVIGAFLIQFCGFGYTAAFGVYQDYYVRVHITNATPSTISWIGSTNAFMLIAGGLFAGRLYDRGYFYHLLWGGSLLSSFSLFMLSLTKPGHFYQVFLTQAIGAGIGAGMLYVPSVSLISQYFKRRRSSVMTFVAAGSSLGSVVHPIMLNNTLGKIGFANATRANAGLITGLYIIACLLMRTRLPPPKDIPDMTKVVKKFSRDKPLVVASIGFFLTTAGLYFVIFYLQLDSIQHGIDEKFAFYSLVILNFCQFIGRIVSGFVVNHFGVMQCLIFSAFSTSVITFGMIGLRTEANVVVIAVLNGLFSGSYMGLSAPMAVELVEDISELGLRIGFCFLWAGFGSLIGGPINGALLTLKFIWWRPAVFSGTLTMIGTFAFLATFYLYRRQHIKTFKATQAVVNEAEAIDGSSTTETETEKVATSDAATPSPPVPV